MMEAYEQLGRCIVNNVTKWLVVGLCGLIFERKNILLISNYFATWKCLQRGAEVAAKVMKRKNEFSEMIYNFRDSKFTLSLSLNRAPSLSLSVCVYETITIYLLHNNTLSERSLSHVNLRLPYHQKPNTLSRTITFILSHSLSLSLLVGKLSSYRQSLSFSQRYPAAVDLTSRRKSMSGGLPG